MLEVITKMKKEIRFPLLMIQILAKTHTLKMTFLKVLTLIHLF